MIETLKVKKNYGYVIKTLAKHEELFYTLKQLRKSAIHFIF
jgi:hypothetical protein